MSIQLLRFLKYQFRKVLVSLLERLDTDKPAPFHKHSPGDGLHPITEGGEILPDGSMQEGDKSDICIIANAQTLCSVFGLPPFWLLWTEAYPDDPMSAEDQAVIVAGAEPYLNEFNALLPDTRRAILTDLRAIRCEKLAENIGILLKPFDQTEQLLDEKKNTP